MKKVLFFLMFATLMMTGCNKDEHEPQPPQAAIENLSGLTSVALGESVTLKANVISALTTTIAWSVDGQAIAGATGETFEFSSNQTGEHAITLTVTNEDGTITDATTITVYYQIDFEDVRVLSYLAGPTVYGENLYSSFGEGQYIGYDDPCGLKMMIIEDDPYGMGMSREFWNGGIAISQWNDMTTEGYLNQCSAYSKDAVTGFGGYNGSKTFAVNNNSGVISFEDGVTECTFYHFWVINTTYTALSMMNGDGYGAKIFELGDWFKLTVTAFDKNETPTGTPVEFYLADFRTASSPGIVTEWTKVDLKPLGNNVHSIQFNLESSDVGEWGMNTPAYFCFDNLALIKK